MKQLLRLVLPCLLAIWALSPAIALDWGKLDPLATATPLACPPPPQICMEEEPDPTCYPSFTACERVYEDAPQHSHQKANGVCVYICYYTETCFDAACGTVAPIVTEGGRRIRHGPFAANQCPMFIVPQGGLCRDAEEE